jgi:hypothetical protein
MQVYRVSHFNPVGIALTDFPIRIQLKTSDYKQTNVLRIFLAVL